MFVVKKPFRLDHLATCLALTALAFACPGTARAQESTPLESPESLVDAWVEMWNTYDLDQVSRLFLDDPGLTYFSSETQGVIQGMEAVLAHHRGFDFVPGGQAKGTRLWVEELTVSEFGQAAVLTGIWFFASADPSDEPPQRGPVTFVCVRRGGHWQFVHMSFSNYPPDETP